MINYYGYLQLEKLRFAEEQRSGLLNQMEGQKEPTLKVMIPGKIFLMRVSNQPDPILVLILAILDDHVIVCNKSDHQKVYINIASYSQAFEESVYKIDKLTIESVSLVTQPKEADLLREFKKYQKSYREHIAERTEYIKETAAKKHYPSYKSKKEIPEDVYSNRSDLVLQNLDFTDNEYDEITESGIYHLTTIIHRMKNTKSSDAQLFYKALYNHNKDFISKIDFIDYGFIDSELISNLTFSKLILEKNLFVSYCSGNKYLALLLLLYEYYHSNSNQKDILKEYIKIFSFISRKVDYTPQEKDLIKEFIKEKLELYYIQLFD